MNFHMNGMEKAVAELHGMLKIAKYNIKKNLNHVMMVQKKKEKRKCSMLPKGKGKEKLSDKPSSSKPKTKVKSDPSPDEECFHCHKKGHWFRNCKKYLEEEQQKKESETSTSVINIIEINIALSSNDSWVFEINIAAIAVDTYHMLLPSGLVWELNNCYCIPALCKNIISYSYLEEVDGYEIIIKSERRSIYYNVIFYAHCPLVNGLYVFDLEDKSVYNINMKSARLNDLNPTFI
jgi:hypothetical protein